MFHANIAFSTQHRGRMLCGTHVYLNRAQKKRGRSAASPSLQVPGSFTPTSLTMTHAAVVGPDPPVLHCVVTMQCSRVWLTCDLVLRDGIVNRSRFAIGTTLTPCTGHIGWFQNAPGRSADQPVRSPELRRGHAVPVRPSPVGHVPSCVLRCRPNASELVMAVLG